MTASNPIPLAELLNALRAMQGAHSIGDFVYQVRESEVSELPDGADSWAGPKVQAWNNGAIAITRALKHGIAGEGPIPGCDLSSLIRRAIFRTEGAYFAFPDTPEAREVFARLMRNTPDDALQIEDFVAARQSRAQAFDRVVALSAKPADELLPAEISELHFCRVLLTGETRSPGEERLEGRLDDAMRTLWIVVKTAGGEVTVPRHVVDAMDLGKAAFTVRDDHATGARTYIAYNRGEPPPPPPPLH